VCIKVNTGTIRVGVNGALPAALGVYTEIISAASPILGWNFIVVGFDTNAGVSRFRVWLRKPDGTLTNAGALSFVGILF
jgi:hypothetical protein